MSDYEWKKAKDEGKKRNMDKYKVGAEFAEDHQEQYEQDIRIAVSAFYQGFKMHNRKRGNPKTDAQCHLMAEQAYKDHQKQFEGVRFEESGTESWSKMHTELGLTPPPVVSIDRESKPMDRAEYDATQKANGYEWNPEGYWITPEVKNVQAQMKSNTDAALQSAQMIANVMSKHFGLK